MCCSSLCHIVLHCNALTDHIATFRLFFHRLKFCRCCCCSTWIGCITCIHLFSYTYMYITIHTYIILYWIDLPLLVFSLFLTGWTFVIVVVAAQWMYHLHLLKLAYLHLHLLTLAYLHLHLLTSVNTCHFLLCNVQPFPLQAFVDALVVAARWIYLIALYYFATTHSLFLHRRCCCCNALDVHGLQKIY